MLVKHLKYPYLRMKIKTVAGEDIYIGNVYVFMLNLILSINQFYSYYCMNVKLLLKNIDHAYFGMLFSLIKNINIYMKDKQ